MTTLSCPNYFSMDDDKIRGVVPHFISAMVGDDQLRPFCRALHLLRKKKVMGTG